MEIIFWFIGAGRLKMCHKIDTYLSNIKKIFKYKRIMSL